jgi:DHA1 family solute carrier family 18 vesicular amine transporter 1/2
MSPAAGSHPRAWLFRILIYGLVLASAAAQFAIVPVMPVYAHRLGLSGFEQGMVLGATGLAMLAVCVPAGALADRVGARRLTLCAGLLMAIALFAQSLADSFPLLLGSRLAFGIGYGVVWTAGLSWIASTAGRGSGLGGPVACAGVGGVAGPAASGALAQAFGLAVPALATAAVFALITAGLAALRMPAGPDARPAPVAASLRAAISDRAVVCTAAAVLAVGVTTGVTALLVPAELHAAGASPGRIGLDFSVAGMLFAVGSTLTAAAGRRALRTAVVCAGLLALTAALSPAVLSTAPLALVAMLCGTTTARSVLWTVSYPLAAAGARRAGAGLGVVVGLLNGVWAATAVLSPLGAGLGTEHLSPRAVFGLTEALCAAVLAATVVVAWRTRPAARAPRLRPHHRRIPAARPATTAAGGLVPAPRQAAARGPAAGVPAPVPGGKARPRLPRPLTPRALTGPGTHGRHPYQRPARRAGRRRPHRPPRAG